MDLMIDLETLGKAPNAVFTQIGWALFDPCGTAEGMSVGTIYVDPRDAEKCGLKIDADTVLWWLGQEPAAQQLMLADGAPLGAALCELTALFQTEKPSRVWANSPSFDIVILESGYRACGLTPPWKYWNIMDVRTLVSVTGTSKVKPQVAHVASADARAQAETVQRALKSLQRITSG